MQFYWVAIEPIHRALGLQHVHAHMYKELWQVVSDPLCTLMRHLMRLAIVHGFSFRFIS